MSSDNLQLSAILRQGLLYAKTAVERDTNKEYETAYSNYKTVLEILNAATSIATVSGDLPQIYFQEIEKLKETYSNRVDILYKNLPSLSLNADSKKTVTEKVFATSEIINISEALPDQLPRDPYFRPFWLFKLFSNTITNGGYISRSIYIPKEIWLQPYKFTAIEAKLSCCEAVVNMLDRLSSFDYKEENSATAANSELDFFCQTLDVVQNSLASKLAYIDSVRQETDSSFQKVRQFGNALAKGATRLAASTVKSLDEEAQYVLLLKYLFEDACILEEWYTFFSKNNSNQTTTSVIDKLIRVSEFFYDVVCQMVLKDVSGLLQNYVKHASVAFFS